MSLVDQDWYPRLRPYIRAEKVSKDRGPHGTRLRIEINEPPRSLADEFVTAHMLCGHPRCGRTMHPIRRRKKWGTLYYAMTCPLSVDVSCSRGMTQRIDQEFARIADDVEQWRGRLQGRML